jgi:hypothetical protein
MLRLALNYSAYKNYIALFYGVNYNLIQILKIGETQLHIAHGR